MSAPCAHSRFRAQPNRFAACTQLSIYLANTTSCPECSLLLRVIEEVKPGWIDGNRESHAFIEVAHKAGRRRGNVPATVNLLISTSGQSADFPEDLKLVYSFQYFRRSRAEPMYEGSHNPSKSVLYQTLDIISDSGSKAAFDRAAKWLSYCVNHDKECKLPSSGFMPRRLINVGSEESGIDPFLFEPTQTAPYACLSYCWGPVADDVLKTTKGNVSHHFNAISMTLLPKSVSDAIICCRGLGIPNMWIDSLCIIQDDIDSWLQDSAQMRDIYMHSVLTIAAEEPESCKLGFLGPQKFGDSEWQRRLKVNVPTDTSGSMDEVFIRPSSFSAQEFSNRCSLDKRGWCFQETILPNRRLCFNGNEMIWECLCRNICECGHVLWAPRDTQFGTLNASIKAGSSQPYDDWRAIVEEYTNRSLTKKTDKLSAVSGLAKAISNVLYDNDGEADTYLAGLWMKEFLSDLAWRVVSPEIERNKEQAYTAPSWSWASVDSSVRYDFWRGVSTWKYKPIQERNCTLEEVIVQNTLSSDMTGPVTAAHAILTGQLAAVELAVLDETLSNIWLSKRENDVDTSTPLGGISLARSVDLCTTEVFLDYSKKANLTSENEQSSCWIQGKCESQCCCWGTQPRTNHQSPDTSLFYAFKLFTWTAAGNFDDAGKRKRIPPETWYLLLQKSSTSQNTFERVGIGLWSSRLDKRSKEQADVCPLFHHSELVTIKIV